jgi:hypothetical protein
MNLEDILYFYYSSFVLNVSSTSFDSLVKNSLANNEKNLCFILIFHRKPYILVMVSFLIGTFRVGFCLHQKLKGKYRDFPCPLGPKCT